MGSDGIGLDGLVKYSRYPVFGLVKERGRKNGGLTRSSQAR
jgi:hypothetical protein